MGTRCRPIRARAFRRTLGTTRGFSRLSLPRHTRLLCRRRGSQCTRMGSILLWRYCIRHLDERHSGIVPFGRVSINMLAAAAALLLLEKGGNLPPSRQITLRGDNTAACNAVNTGVVHSPAMRFALRVFIRVCQQTKVRCSMLHVGTKRNTIPDHASRGELHLADAEIKRLCWNRRDIDIRDQVQGWELEMHKWAKKHSTSDWEPSPEDPIAEAIEEVQAIDLRLTCHQQ